MSGKRNTLAHLHITVRCQSWKAAGRVIWFWVCTRCLQDSRTGVSGCLAVRLASVLTSFQSTLYLKTGGHGHVTAVDKTVFAKRFSNTRLTCSALSWHHCYIGPVKLTWHFGNKTLQNSTKYTITIEQHKKKECKRRLFEAESTLEIAGVSNTDFGKYHCQLSCLIFSKTDKAIIELVPVAEFWPGMKYYQIRRSYINHTVWPKIISWTWFWVICLFIDWLICLLLFCFACLFVVVFFLFFIFFLNKPH